MILPASSAPHRAPSGAASTISGELSMPSDAAAALDDLCGQRAVAAADVEDPLARLRVEQVERRRASSATKAPTRA